jgi:hypothetical protein
MRPFAEMTRMPSADIWPSEQVLKLAKTMAINGPLWSRVKALVFRRDVLGMDASTLSQLNNRYAYGVDGHHPVPTTEWN